MIWLLSGDAVHALQPRKFFWAKAMPLLFLDSRQLEGLISQTNQRLRDYLPYIIHDSFNY